ncbi:MAG: DNA translocase FtsK 4TM domain-containing protein, partial [Selenomonadales bacterium]|nr:DNA translocase FtsK 4TM domain-containing protein [Selenomonadales bacterium]
MQKKRTRRGSDNKNNNAKVTGRKNELIGVGLVALGMVFICGIMGLNVGFVGIYFAKFLQYFCGIGSMIPAVAFIYLGYNYIMKGTGFQLDKRSIGIGLMFVTLLSIFHHFMVPAGSEILPSELQRGGGLLGGIVLLFMRKLFGVAGAIVILGAGFVGSILLATTWSLANG